MFRFLSVFFFNETAPTEIYTYSHTLSLHAALPISADGDRRAIRFGDHWVAKDGLPVDGYDEAPVAAHLKGQDIRVGADLGLGEGRGCPRSEEHTSELQSLMRISYAVFCLKKKKGHKT